MPKEQTKDSALFPMDGRIGGFWDSFLGEGLKYESRKRLVSHV